MTEPEDLLEDNGELTEEEQQAALDAKPDSRFSLPTYDTLRPMQQKLVQSYCACLDKDLAAENAGYKDKSPKQRRKKVHDLFHNPKILKAIEEVLDSKLTQLDNGKAALATRLMYMSIATITDVCTLEQYHNNKGEAVPNRKIWVPKQVEDIEPHFVPALALVKSDTYGVYYFDNMGQVRITNQLTKLMLWDQQELDQSQPIVFNFGNIQESEYEKPEDTIDTSFVDDDSGDEVDQLTRH